MKHSFNTVPLENHFKRLFNSSPKVYRSPGRINLIGEHTDYNEGFVLPASIDMGAYVGIEIRSDDEIHLYAVAFDEYFNTAKNNLPKRKSWTDYVLGVVDQLQKKGLFLKGFNLVLDGDVAIGAGLSSSAAVECAVAYALNDQFNLGLTKMELVKLAQKAEHEFAGVMCGIMDQFASVFGKADQVVKLDCRSLQYEYYPFKMDGFKIVLLNSNVTHSLASSEYNVRRQQAEQGVSWIREKYPEVQSLRDVDMPMLRDLVAPKDALIFKRCKYVVEENQRLLGACDDLKNGNIKAMGKKMFATHDGLSKEYEVSCKEVDWLVDFVRGRAQVYGARMMGGGFGGCSINLVDNSAIDELVEQAGIEYAKKMNNQLSVYIVSIQNGTSDI